MQYVMDRLDEHDFLSLVGVVNEITILIIMDKHGRITYANKKLYNISKYNQDEIIGSTHDIFDLDYHSKDFFKNMWETINSSKSWKAEVCYKAKDGTYFWVNTCIIPIVSEQGEIKKYVSIGNDITDKKNAEEKLKVYANKLEASNKELQEFASAAAHDLQEPLRKIGTFSSRLEKLFDKNVSEEIRTYLDRIQKSTKRMQNLIKDLLTYTRLDVDERIFKLVDLNEILEQVKSDSEILLEKTQGKIEATSLPRIEAEPTQMYQLFQNLINNALKFRKPDIPPVIFLDFHEVSEIGPYHSNDYYQISIKDNCIGFEPKYLDRIFIIFQRLHSKSKYDGSGIGLSLCRKIVERHGGTISAYSKPNMGSTFKITLPKKQAGVGEHYEQELR